MGNDPSEGNARRLGSKQPNSNHCFVCGVKNEHGLGLAFYEAGPGEIYADVVLPERFQGYPGVAHGGIVATMLDEILGRAAMTVDHNKFMVTAKMTVRYRKPVPIGEQLHLTGRLVRSGSRMATSLAELRLPDGSLAAEAEGALIRVPEKDLSIQDLDRLGWQVYPD